MIIKPNIRGFICTTSHPEGCFLNVKKQIDYIKQKEKIPCKKNALIIGCSSGYGLSSRIVCSFLKNCKTLGVMFEKQPKRNKTATAGWYNTKAFEEFAEKEEIYSKTINGDAFSEDVIKKTIEIIKKDIGKIGILIYSLASSKRKIPNGKIISSALKTVGEEYENKTIDVEKEEIYKIKIPPATDQEISNTIKIMGGENLITWVDELYKENTLEDDATVISFSYEGPKLTHPIYKNGTIGLAKKDLKEATNKINEKYKNINAFVSINKALVTQASSAIPIVPLYLTILYKIMKEKKIHEGCIEQMYRLFSEKLKAPIKLDSEKRIRLDDFEMSKEVQEKVKTIWNEIDSNNIKKFCDLDGYKKEFLNIFGFGFEEIDYDKEIDPNIQLKNTITII